MKFLLFIISSFMLCFAVFAGDSLTIIHMNDTHSSFDPAIMKLTLNGKEVKEQVGGMARAAHLIKQLKARHPDALLLHAGDAEQGTLYYTLFKGEPDAEALNLIGFEAFTVGNHEFDDGDEALKSFVSKLKMPVLTANVLPDCANPLAGAFTPYIIKEINGVKYGIIGLTVAKKTKESSHPGPDVNFFDEAESAARFIRVLKHQNVDRIILLSHFGYENDVELAKKLTDVDIIIGGDTHTLLGDQSSVGLNSSGPYPTIVKNRDGDTVCITQAWAQSRAVGELDVQFDGGRVKSCGGELSVLVKSRYPDEDKDMAALVSKYSSQVEQLKNTPIGYAGETIAHVRIPGQSYDGITLPKGSEIAAVAAKAFYETSLRSDIAIQNAGGVRVSIPEGPVSVGTAYTLLPFGNTLFEIAMTGSEIKQALEDALEATITGGSTGAFPYAYGIKYDIDASKPFGGRFSNLEVLDRNTGEWSAIDTDKMYMVVTNSFTAEGKDGYATFAEIQKKRGKGTDTYLDYAKAFADYVRKRTANGEKIMKLPEKELPVKNFTPPPGFITKH